MRHMIAGFGEAGECPQPVNLAEIIGAFSHALDITEGQPEGHSLRTCWIGSAIGRELGLPQDELYELYYTLLLKDLGCSSNAARIAEVYRADDLGFKRDFKLVGSGLADMLGFVFSHTAKGEGLGARVGAISNILRNGPRIAGELIQTRCERGADIARRLRFSDTVAAGIYSLDEHWDGSGKPHGLSGSAIPLFSRIALVAQAAEVYRAHAGPDAALAEIARRTGSWFDPEVAGAFLGSAGQPSFWEDAASPALAARLSELLPTPDVAWLDEDYLDDIAEAFGGVVDAKSPYTGGHSARVADYADRIAERLDYEPAKRRWLRRGALLHDIGKLGVSNALLDKPGKLDEAEWKLMRGHAAHTQAILSRISAFHDLAPIAAAHHERLDGQGYPRGIGAEDISFETRIITVSDFYDALTADRPYRAAMPAEQALAVIGEAVGAAVDARCFEALKDMVHSA